MKNVGIIQTEKDKTMTMTQTAFCANATGIMQHILKMQ